MILLFQKPSPPLFYDGRFFDVVHFSKLSGQISVAFALDAVLRRAAAARSALAVIGIEAIDDIHARYDLAERCKALSVQRGVVGEIDEHLGGAGVGTGRGKGDVAAPVALLHRIVLDARLAPHRREFWIAIDAELHHEARDDAEEPGIIVKTVLDQIVE